MNNAQAERWVNRRSNSKQGAAGPKGPMGRQGDAQRTAAVAKLNRMRRSIGNETDIQHERRIADTLRQVGLFLRAAQQNDMARAQSPDTLGLSPSSLQEFGRYEQARNQPADSFGLTPQYVDAFNQPPDSYGLTPQYVDAFKQSPDGYGLSPHTLRNWRQQEAARRQPADTFGLYPPPYRPMRGAY